MSNIDKKKKGKSLLQTLFGKSLLHIFSRICSSKKELEPAIPGVVYHELEDATTELPPFPTPSRVVDHELEDATTELPPLPTPSRVVDHKLEDATTKLPPLPTPSTRTRKLIPVKVLERPGYGTTGTTCVVKTNHFSVKVQGNVDLHEYSVKITPEVANKAVKRSMISNFIDKNQYLHLGNRLPVYDGFKRLFTAGPLPFESEEFVIEVSSSSSKDIREEQEYKIVITFVSRISVQELLKYTYGAQKTTGNEAIHALNLVLRQAPQSQLERRWTAKGFECWLGFNQSLRPTQNGLSLILGMSARTCFEPINVAVFVVQMLDITDCKRPLFQIDRVKIEKVLKGVKVQLIHREGRHRISGITSHPSNLLRFLLDDTKTIKSVSQYFCEKYGLELQYPHWPCLLAGSGSKPIYLPMEVCRIVEGQTYKGPLTENQVTSISRMRCKPPSTTETILTQVVNHNNYANDKYALEFGLEVSGQLTLVNSARVLPSPLMVYRDQFGYEVNVQPQSGSWSMSNLKMVDGGRLSNYACVNFSQELSLEAADAFFKELIGVCISKGMQICSTEPVVPVRLAPLGPVERVLFEIKREADLTFQKRKRESTQVFFSPGLIPPQRLELLIVILPDDSGLYGKIKRICDTELGVVSQCCQPAKVIKSPRQYLENLSMKINVKVGGRNTVLRDALPKILPHHMSYKKTIIFGADVSHPQPGDDSSPSTAAVVASMDWPQASKYRCVVAAQPHRQELINDLFIDGAFDKGMVCELLTGFWRSAGSLPDSIIFFRDGVSEGQFAQVLRIELDAIRKACRAFKESYQPPITFVVVQKRHRTRFFPNDHDDPKMKDESGNILPGTVIDTEICHPTEFDFYLCSHAGMQGTSRPTRYRVLFDENNITANQMQILTNNLCYTSAKCTRSVSVVAPVYYAHLGASRARHYVEGQALQGASCVSSGCGGKNTKEKTTSIHPLPKIPDCVKKVMFYC